MFQKKLVLLVILSFIWPLAARAIDGRSTFIDYRDDCFNLEHTYSDLIKFDPVVRRVSEKIKNYRSQGYFLVSIFHDPDKRCHYRFGPKSFTVEPSANTKTPADTLPFTFVISPCNPEIDYLIKEEDQALDEAREQGYRYLESLIRTGDESCVTVFVYDGA